jgi:hypothetical protein
VLKSGFVLVGDMPTTDGTSMTVKPGSLIGINSAGQTVWTLKGTTYINGPWDMTVYDQGSTVTVFIANVLNATIERLVLSIRNGSIALTNATQISSNYMHRSDPAARRSDWSPIAAQPTCRSSNSNREEPTNSWTNAAIASAAVSNAK